MKRLVVVFILLTGLYSSSAQSYYPLVTSGKVWSTRHIYCKIWPDTLSSYIKFGQDVTFGQYVYKTILQTPNSDSSSWWPSGYIREDSMKHVYTYNSFSGYQYLLYDFSALPGDTLFLSGNTDPYVVDSITWTTLLDGSQRRQFFLHCYDCIEIWIEGVGCLRGVMDAGMCWAVGDNPTLMCFIEHDTIKYHNPDFEDCSLTTGISEVTKDPPVMIYPNPAKDQVTIRIYAEPESTVFEIFDLLGRKVLSQPLTQRETTLKLNTYNLVQGTYIYRISENPGIFCRGTIVLQ
jgi:hypothetical protein